MTSNLRSHRNAGLTLIQLLVALLVIVILADVFYARQPRSSPMYGTACISNIKQMGVGFLIYSNDYDERLPSVNHWMDTMQPYVKYEATYHCPELPNSKEGYGYAMRTHLGGTNIAKLKQASKTPLVFDSLDSGRSAHMEQVLVTDFLRHKGAQNIGFADGHAKASQLVPSFAADLK